LPQLSVEFICRDASGIYFGDEVLVPAIFMLIVLVSYNGKNDGLRQAAARIVKEI
jgi:hypothetical protein